MELGNCALFHSMAGSLDLGYKPLRLFNGADLLSHAPARRFDFMDELHDLWFGLGSDSQHQSDASGLLPRRPDLDLLSAHRPSATRISTASMYVCISYHHRSLD